MLSHYSVLVARINTLLPVPTALLPIHLSADAAGKAAEDGPGAGATASYWGNPDRVPSSWFLPGPVLAITAIWEANQLVGDLFLSLFCLLVLPFK